jgi:hypothetical protein
MKATTHEYQQEYIESVWVVALRIPRKHGDWLHASAVFLFARLKGHS